MPLEDQIWSWIVEHFGRRLALILFLLIAAWLARDQIKSLLGINQFLRFLKRRQFLKRELAESRARCVERWQAAGVSLIDAREFADDFSLGAPRDEYLPTSQRPLVLMTGDLGMGKSLIGERIFQQSIVNTICHPLSPLPVHLNAQQISTTLPDCIITKVGDADRPESRGAFLVIDGLDEVVGDKAFKLVSDARVLVEAWPNTSALLISRPRSSYVFDNVEKDIRVSPLQESEGLRLASRVAGHEVNVPIRWPDAMREVIRVPLFAIMLGSYLREHPEAPKTLGELLDELVRRALLKKGVDAAAGKLLRKLAVMAIDREGGVPLNEVTITEQDLHSLLNSGLVVERAGAVNFPLAILTHWFGAQALSEGVVKGEEPAADEHRLTKWRYPLVVEVATRSHDQVYKTLAPIAALDPGFVAQILEDSLTDFGLGEEFSAPPALEAGRCLRDAMRAWVRGLGPLASRIAPVRTDGSVRTLGVTKDGASVIASWRADDDSSRDVIQLTSSFQPGFQRIHMARPGGQPAWAWRWTLEELISRMKDLIRHREISIPSVPLLDADLAPPGMSFSEWQIFSEKRLLDRSEQVFTAALDEYQRFTSSSFQKLRPWMRKAYLLPACLRGWLVLHPAPIGPSLTWFLEPLPPDRGNQVDIKLAEISGEELRRQAVRSWERFANLRPRAAERFGPSYTRMGLKIFGSKPIEDLVYDWLTDDLKETYWL